MRIAPKVSTLYAIPTVKHFVHALALGGTLLPLVVSAVNRETTQKITAEQLETDRGVAASSRQSYFQHQGLINHLTNTNKIVTERRKETTDTTLRQIYDAILAETEKQLGFETGSQITVLGTLQFVEKNAPDVAENFGKSDDDINQLEEGWKGMFYPYAISQHLRENIVARVEGQAVKALAGETYDALFVNPRDQERWITAAKAGYSQPYPLRAPGNSVASRLDVTR